MQALTQLGRRSVKRHDDPLDSLPGPPTDWVDLTDETWENVISFLPPPDIGALAAVSRTFNGVAGQKELWLCLLRRDFKVQAQNRAGDVFSNTLRRFSQSLRGGGEALPRAATQLLAAQSTIAGAAVDWTRPGPQGYVMRYEPPTALSSANVISNPFMEYQRLHKAHREEIARARAHTKLSVQISAAAVNSRYLRCGLDCLQFPLGVGMLACYLFGSTLLLACKLTSFPHIPWFVVVLPVFGTLCLPLCCSLLGMVVERLSLAAPSTSVWHRVEAGDTHNLVDYAARVKTFFASNHRKFPKLRLVSLFMNCVALFALPTLIILKLEGHLSDHWGVVLIPLWWLLGCGCTLVLSGCVPYSANDNLKTGAVCAGLFCVVSYPFLITLAAVVAIAEGADIRLVYAFIPLFVVDFALLCAGILMVVLYFKSHDEDERASLASLGGTAAVLMTLGLIATAWPAAVEFKTHGEIAIMPIVVVVCVSMGLIALGGCVLSGFLCCKARRLHFQDLYRFQWMQWRARPPLLPGGVLNPMQVNQHHFVDFADLNRV